ncbi:uncharacterized protein [Nicotiana tomentosiformis]|uniref:uncharacterized protein n=1 Tax=Nicotiana tomentosiformis TaxID=4098 RepID=UPI00388C9759
MKIALLGKRKLGFVNGTCMKESCTAELQEQWKTCNIIVLSWLMNTVSKELLCGIAYTSNAHLVWEDLRERFDKVNRMRIFQLHRAIDTLSQGTDSVSCYFTKLKDLWIGHDAMVPKANSRNHVDHLEQQRLLQFLSGFNDSYDQARRQNLIKSNVPSINQAYVMVIEDESRQCPSMGVVIDKNEPVAMHVSRNQSYKGKKPFMQIEHCGYKGHSKENCYKLIGYPKDFKGKKRFNHPNTGQFDCGSGGANGQFGRGTPHFNDVNNVSSNAGSGSNAGAQCSSRCDLQDAFAGNGPFFTEEQYKQILALLNKEPADNQNNMNNQSNMAGITVCFMSKDITSE